MTVRARLSRPDSRLHLRRAAGRGAHPPARRGSGPAIHAEIRGLHEGGPPLDQALYTCHCGFAFEAPVLTSVNCPHCGSGQAW
jgi:hypothetical protein